MNLNKKQIKFLYSKEHKNLFNSQQLVHFSSIEKIYIKLLSRCVPQVDLPVSTTHKKWIASRVNLHVNTSIMRLLYLTENFCDASKKFNAPAVAVLVKAMLEIPLHMGYLVWILSEARNLGFEKIRIELDKIAFGNRDKNTGLTYSGKINAKTYYERADAMVKKLFKDYPESINIFEKMYKESNATGHHNHEAQMLCGIQNGGSWKAKDRMELFQLFTNSIFQFFMHCDALLGMTDIFLSAIDHYLENLPDYFEKNK